MSPLEIDAWLDVTIGPELDADEKAWRDHERDIRDEWAAADEDPATYSTLPAPADKACGCGEVHDYYAWCRLPFVGVMDDGEGGQLTLRNCGCGSTLAVEVPR